MQVDDWRGTLVIGLKYGDANATKDAKSILDDLLRPSQKLELIRAHNVRDLDDWIRPAILALLTGPKGSLTAEDYDILGGVLTFNINSVRIDLERQRNYLVIKIFEAVHSTEHCNAHTKCAAAWGLAWVAAARVHVCNEAEEGVAMMRRLSEMQIPNMTLECHDLTLSALAHSGLLHRYHRIIECGIEKITKLL